jgi:hypothetical protein
MAAEERQHEEWNAVVVAPAGTAKMANCELPEKPAIKKQTTKGHASEISSEERDPL